MSKLPPQYEKFNQHHPEVARAYEALGDAVRKDGPLSDREVALVKLALAAGGQLEGAVHSHTRRGRDEAGLSDDDVRHVAVLAIPTLGFPTAMMARSWIEDVLKP